MAHLVEPPATAQSSTLPTDLACAGCGWRAPAGALPLRCPHARPGDDIDHLIARRLDPARLAWPIGAEVNPFIRYRTLWHGYQVARAAGRSDAELVGEIERLDDAIARVDGHGFTVTPLARADRLSAELGFGATGGVLVKDETANVSGSHKARHLFGTLLALRLAGHDEPRRPLAIASCGNAALAAAVVARAAERELHVFVPTDAEPAVLRQLATLGAQVTICERRVGESGDPSVLRMREAVAAGALPFTCQGTENGLAIEGGLTLGYEIADFLRASGRHIDHLFIQVGGGALASSVGQALAEARALGAIDTLPRLHAVQTRNAHPLARAYHRVRARLSGRTAVSADELAAIARGRSAFMWPWTPAPQSIATGILDDETYDWLAVVAQMLASGGQPVLAGENTLREANRLAVSTTGIDVDITGSAGLAGLLSMLRLGEVRPDQTCAVLFTGVRRNGGSR
jgi:threonine synthase